ncbi:hypothetical protein HDU96_010926 [Phlyctochytrium bullatum]|nr:hypothetical protein HDU96_010926 [Phlyctochytrium bullatum]
METYIRKRGNMGSPLETRKDFEDPTTTRRPSPTSQSFPAPPPSTPAWTTFLFPSTTKSNAVQSRGTVGPKPPSPRLQPLGGVVGGGVAPSLVPGRRASMLMTGVPQQQSAFGTGATETAAPSVPAALATVVSRTGVSVALPGLAASLARKPRGGAAALAEAMLRSHGPEGLVSAERWIAQAEKARMARLAENRELVGEIVPALVEEIVDDDVKKKEVGPRKKRPAALVTMSKTKSSLVRRTVVGVGVWAVMFLVLLAVLPHLESRFPTLFHSFAPVASQRATPAQPTNTSFSFNWLGDAKYLENAAVEVQGWWKAVVGEEAKPAVVVGGTDEAEDDVVDDSELARKRERRRERAWRLSPVPWKNYGQVCFDA